MSEVQYSQEDLVSQLANIYKQSKVDNLLQELENKLSSQFVWAIKSEFDDSDLEASFYTLNDLTLYYNSTTKLYFLDIDTLVVLNSNIDKINYLNRLLDRFTSYMYDNHYSTNIPFEWCGSGLALYFQASSIEQLYTQFNIFVKGFISLYSE